MTIHRPTRWARWPVLALALTAPACGARQVPLVQMTADELWLQGVESFNDEDWREAARFLERYVVVGGSDPRVYQARYYVGQARFELEEYVTAAAEFSRLAGDLGRTDLADEARFLACRSYAELSPAPQLDQEYTRAAIEHCQSLVDYFPDSEYADDARAIVDRMWGKLAEKVYDNGEWYFRRRAFDSAIIYYEDVVARYPQTEWAPKALGRLVEIYTTLEYPEELEAVRERLLREYPESAAAGAVGA